MARLSGKAIAIAQLCLWSSRWGTCPPNASSLVAKLLATTSVKPSAIGTCTAIGNDEELNATLPGFGDPPQQVNEPVSFGAAAVEEDEEQGTHYTAGEGLAHR